MRFVLGMPTFFVACVALSWAVLGDSPAQAPAPPEGLKSIQGEWKVTLRIRSRRDDFPDSLGLKQKGDQITIEGNQLKFKHDTAATLTTDLPPGPLHEQVGWKELNRLVLITLPDGKGLWCSYGFRGKQLQITYPHTTSCHRGSGQIVYLERVGE